MPYSDGLGSTSDLAGGLMLHFGIAPTDHREVLAELDQEIGDLLLDLGRDVLRRHGLINELGLAEATPAA